LHKLIAVDIDFLMALAGAFFFGLLLGVDLGLGAGFDAGFGLEPGVGFDLDFEGVLRFGCAVEVVGCVVVDADDEEAAVNVLMVDGIFAVMKWRQRGDDCESNISTSRMRETGRPSMSALVPRRCYRKSHGEQVTLCCSLSS
jgi:hypothetical protein